MIFMALSDRIESTIERWSGKWKDRLAGWMGSWVLGGLNSFLADNEPEAIDLVRQQLDQIRNDSATPQSIRDLIDKLTAGTQPIPVAILIALGVILMIPTLTSIVQPLGRIINYKQERLFKTYRIDPLSFINLVRRFPGKWNNLVGDLQDQGVDDQRLDALKDATLFYPGAQDLVTWLAREVFEPEARQKYGLDDEADLIDFGLFAGAGISEDQALNYWRAHWQHPSFIQMMELLHRGLLTSSGNVPREPATAVEWEARDREGEKEMYEWYRLVEVPPHWRNLLTESLWNIPTRVDVRRWWDMRVISEQELYSIYHRQGYRGKDLENYVLWTKVYTDFPILLARWTNGWISLDEVRQRLEALGMSADRIEDMLQEKIDAEQPARVADEKQLTKAEIVKGVKNEVISPDEGIELLMDLNYGRAEAEYILAINIEALRGSPESFTEFKDLTQKWRQAVGEQSKPVTDELKQAAAEVVRLTNQVKALRSEVNEEKAKLIDEENLPSEATARRDDLQVTLNRAEAELEDTRGHYNAVKAEYYQRSQEG